MVSNHNIHLNMSGKLRVGWHREHFLSPLLQYAAKDQGETFELVECPGGTGDMQVKLKNGEIDVCIGELRKLVVLPCGFGSSSGRTKTDCQP